MSKGVLWCLALTAMTFAGTRLFASEGAEIQRQIDAAAAGGGGRVVVPAGVHEVGSLRLRSHVELHLERGAVLRGADKSEAYADFPDEICSIHPEGSKKVLIFAYDCEDIAITGEGTIDGQGPKFFDTTRPAPSGSYYKPPVQRPRMVQFVRVKGVRLNGVTFRDSPCWTMLIRLCENVEVDGIKVIADQRMINNDGIDFDCCRQVKVRRSVFRTGDDCLIVRAMREAGTKGPFVCEDIEFSDCDLDSWCQTIRLGCPSDDTIRNVRICNIRARGRNGIFADFPERYLRSDDSGYMDIHDVKVDGFTGEFRGSALQIVSEPGVRVRKVDGIIFRNLKVKSREPLRFIGNAGAEIGSVSLENVVVEVEKEGEPCVVAGCRDLDFKNVIVNGKVLPNGRVQSAPGSDAPLKRKTSVSWESAAKK